MIGSFYAGALHPLFVPAHVMALVALGLLISRQTPSARVALLAVFTLALVAGVLALTQAVAFDNAGRAVLAMALVVGVLVAVDRNLPRIIAGAMEAATGLAVALDSAPHMVSISASTAMLAGTVAGAAIVVTLIAFAAATLSRPWQLIGVRVLGAWIAAGAALALAVQLAR